MIDWRKVDRRMRLAAPNPNGDSMTILASLEFFGRLVPAPRPSKRSRATHSRNVGWLYQESNHSSEARASECF